MKDLNADIIIIGGGLGGVSAALAALRMGRSVILTEEYKWLGGQLTTQAVPPDENPWIEKAGSTASYRQLREGIRNYYRRHYPLTDTARGLALLNPGSGNVSPLTAEPRVGVAVIEEMLAPWHGTERLTVLLNTRPIAVEQTGDRFNAVEVESREFGPLVLHGRYIIDATELGDLLDLGAMEHVIGAEAQSETGEPSALAKANPMDQQAVSWCFAMSYHPDEDHTIDRPVDYDKWRDYKLDFWPDRQVSFTGPDPVTLEPDTRPLFAGDSDAEGVEDNWHYRRILRRRNHAVGHFPSDVCLVNWPQIDYCEGPIVGISPEEAKRHLEGARQLSLSMLYWMQTEAPRHDGGTGYRGLRPAGEVMGTLDGLTVAPYIRESRRIKALFTVTENHVGVDAREGLVGAENFADSVGVGSYRIDLHPSTAPRNYVDIANWPFQIPLGALIPERVENLLPACKNIGSTHITNGCYRLHPVEWNIGEAVGALAAYCLDTGETPRGVRETPEHLSAYQDLLRQRFAIPLEWPRHIYRTARLELFGRAD
ncbi:FAD-dependent oxidoreductase [Tropicimonas sediminicola]|uniref:FAD dependent oxidoreductase n=1 Tax=Tropicimonas sediminicola TaxID=1031541 RepID=A0A239DK16_9RHOB|nr:FAD-dependent oxidoreductase [Tropicimonas sediminicola]SNS32053.1 FAD dependent oxidoreductase [Tropicimonas sediminicola]